MAEKKQEFQYGTSFIPEGEKKYNVIRWGWNGLNRTDDIDTGQLSDAGGVMIDPPYVYPNKKPKLLIDFDDGFPVYTPIFPGDPDALYHPGTPSMIAGFDRFIGIKWWDNTDSKYMFSYLIPNPNDGDLYVRSAKLSGFGTDVPGSILQFNVVDMQIDPDTHLPSGNIAAYTYNKKILIYPDCYSVPYAPPTAYTPIDASSFNTLDNPVPQTFPASVYGSRVFGANSNAVFASSYNSYAEYTLDTADSVSSDHAWWSMAQSNTDADGGVTAIATFDNHVVIFRKDFMQLVYNNKNPFRIVDVGAYGCDSNQSWTILNGVLYFASQEKVYAFSGGTPKEISKKLEIKDLHGAMLGSYRDTVWMQTKDSMYTFKDGVWSDVGNPFYNFPARQNDRVVQFATLDYGLVALVETPPPPESVAQPTYSLWFLDWDEGAMDLSPYATEDWEPDYDYLDWWFETDLMALGRLDVRRIKKFSAWTYGKHNAKLEVYLLPNSEKIHIKGSLTSEQRKQLAPYKVVDTVYVGDGQKLVRILTRQFSSTAHRLLFVGRGYVKIFAAEVKISWGGDLYVES